MQPDPPKKSLPILSQKHPKQPQKFWVTAVQVYYLKIRSAPGLPISKLIQIIKKCTVMNNLVKQEGYPNSFKVSSFPIFPFLCNKLPGDLYQIWYQSKQSKITNNLVYYEGSLCLDNSQRSEFVSPTPLSVRQNAHMHKYSVVSNVQKYGNWEKKNH